MRSIVKILGFTIAVLIVSCNKDDNSTNAPMSQSEMINSAKVEEMSNDVSNVADSQYVIQSNAVSGRMSTADDYLPSCATVTTVEAQGVWTRTVDFGTSGCSLANGNVLMGKIIISGSTDYSQKSQTINVTFDNFYHNNALVQGSKTIVRELKATSNLADIHPVCTMTENFTITKLSDVALNVVGTRIRELVSGFDTPYVLLDNVYWISGNRSVVSSKGTITTTIESPLILRMNCIHIVQGKIDFVKNGKTAVLDYGDGTCDNKATITIEGQTSQILLGK